MVTRLPPVVGFSNAGEHQNCLEDLLKQIAGSHFQSLSSVDLGWGPRNCLSNKFQGMLMLWSGVQMWRTAAPVCALQMLTEGDAAFPASCCTPDPPAEQLSTPLLCTCSGSDPPGGCVLPGSFLHLYSQEIGPNPQACRIGI